MCGIVCFFGILEFDFFDKIMMKCDFCVYRRVEGKFLVCVEICLIDVFFFGDFNDI